MSPSVIFCGIDVSAKPANQQLVTLHERTTAGETELVATFYEPGDVAAIASTVHGFARDAVVAIDAPSGRRLDLLKAGSALRAALALPEGRYERHRVCDALLYRRRLPLYSVPPNNQQLRPWEAWMGLGFDLYAALQGLGLYRPRALDGELEAPVGEGALRYGRLAETYPDAIFCTLLGHRPPPKRTPFGLQQRIAALKSHGVVDEDGGLWHRTLDELDACAAAYAAFALGNGSGSWVGDPREGVILLPVAQLLDSYDPLPHPARARLVHPAPTLN